MNLQKLGTESPTQQQTRGKRVLVILFSLAFLFFVVVPFLTLAHELGHAIVPYFFEKSSVSVRVGPRIEENQRPIFHLKKDRFELRWTSLLRPWQGYCGWSYVTSYKERIAALLLGPVVSFLLASIFFLLIYMYWHSAALSFRMIGLGAALFALTQFLVTAIPMTYPKFSAIASNSVSDGKQIRYLYNKYHRSLASSVTEKPMNK